MGAVGWGGVGWQHRDGSCSRASTVARGRRQMFMEFRAWFGTLCILSDINTNLGHHLHASLELKVSLAIKIMPEDS